jgi:hypothetical protein
VPYRKDRICQTKNILTSDCREPSNKNKALAECKSSAKAFPEEIFKSAD